MKIDDCAEKKIVILKDTGANFSFVPENIVK